MNRQIKRILSLMLSALLLCSALGVSASASESVSGQLSLVSYNVSGIPIFGDTQGTQRKKFGNDRMTEIGRVLSAESGADIVCVQEDFNLHDALAAAMTAFPYQTLTSGGLPLGDGLNTFSNLPIYNVERIKWDSCYGVVSGSADRLAEKGILYSLAEIADGVYIDLYVVHTDAGIDRKSVEARADNFRQIAELLNSRSQERAAVVIGDYNFRYDRNVEDKMYENLIEGAGLTDVWTLLCNGGDYTYENGENWNPTLSDTLDRVMYKNGGGVEFTPEDFEQLLFTDGDGKTYTDHISIKATLSYTVTGEQAAPSELNGQEPIDAQQRSLDEFKAIVEAVVLVFTHLYELFYLVGQGFELLAAEITG